LSDRPISEEVIRVYVENPEEFPNPGNVEEKEPEHFSFSTVAVAYDLAGYNNSEQVLALDPLRKDASILAVDNAVVVCHSHQQVTDPANQISGVPYPQGAYLPAGSSLTVTGTGPAWVVATVSSASRVSVFINRRNA